MDTDNAHLLPVYAEIADASERVADWRLAPATAVIEIAKILTRFELQIEDDDRALLIGFGGGLLRLDRELEKLLRASDHG